MARTHKPRWVLVLTLVLILMVSGIAACQPKEAETKAMPEADEATVEDADKAAFFGVWALASVQGENGCAADLEAGESERIVFTQDDRIYRLFTVKTGHWTAKKLRSTIMRIMQ